MRREEHSKVLEVIRVLVFVQKCFESSDCLHATSVDRQLKATEAYTTITVNNKETYVNWCHVRYSLMQ